MALREEERVTPLAWLAIPVIATLVAVLVMPRVQRSRSRELTTAERAQRLRSELTRGAAPTDRQGRP